MKGIITYPPNGGAKFLDIDIYERNEIKLKTLYVGVCGTDKEIVLGKLPFARPEHGNTLILGHEALAVIEDPGESKIFKKGDVVVPMVRRPGKCKICSIGRWDYCEDGDFVEAGIRGKNGFMREEFYDEERYLVKVNQKDLDILVLTEPLKNVMKMVEIFRFLSGKLPWYCDDSTYTCKNLYVFGTGPEGLLVGSVFKHMGFNVIAVNRHPPTESVSKFLEINGVDYLDTSKEKISERIKKFPMDFAIDAVGSMEILYSIAKNIKNNGIVLLFGTSGQLLNGNKEFITEIVDKNLLVAGSTDGSKQNYVEAVQFIEENGMRLGFNVLISQVFKFDELESMDLVKFLTEKRKDEIKKVIKFI